MPEVRKKELIAKLTAVLGHNPTEDEIHSLCRTTTKKYSHPEVIGWIAGVTEAVINMTEPELHKFKTNLDFYKYDPKTDIKKKIVELLSKTPPII